MLRSSARVLGSLTNNSARLAEVSPQGLRVDPMRYATRHIIDTPASANTFLNSAVTHW